MHLLEVLENRKLYSVTVTQGFPGYYEITSDDAGDAIEVVVSMKSDSFTFNGQTYSNVSFIQVNGNGGDDYINVYSIDGPGMISATIDAGAGDDWGVLSFDGAVYGGSGNDVIVLTDSFRGEAYGEAGDDCIFVQGETVDAELRGGDGNDLLDCSLSNYSCILHGGTGSDTLIGSNYDDQLYGDQGEDYCYGGAGNDEFYYADGDHVDGQGGYDILHGSAADYSNIEEIVA